jgi:hypothetical protein
MGDKYSERVGRLTEAINVTLHDAGKKNYRPDVSVLRPVVDDDIVAAEKLIFPKHQKTFDAIQQNFAPELETVRAERNSYAKKPRGDLAVEKYNKKEIGTKLIDLCDERKIYLGDLLTELSKKYHLAPAVEQYNAMRELREAAKPVPKPDPTKFTLDDLASMSIPATSVAHQHSPFKKVISQLPH